jgi:hypothetical protein
MNINKVAIHGVPRSGTTWLGAIFDSSSRVVYRNQPLFSYAFKSFLSENSGITEINSFFDQIHLSNDEFITQKDFKKKGVIPTFKKTSVTHIVYKEARYHHILNNLLKTDANIRIVGIVRDPRSVIYSWLNAPKEFDKKKWEISKEWQFGDLKNKGKKEEFYGYHKWKEVAQMFLDFKEIYPSQFYLLNYCDLLENTEDTVKKLFDFCNIQYEKQTQDFIVNSKAKDMSYDAYSVYRTNTFDNKWKGNLSNKIVASIESDLRGKPLEMFLE